MSTLLLRLASPLQSWGIDSKFNHRGTECFPSKSAVIGLVAGALGICRDGDLNDLSSLRFGVRVDKEGGLLKDFHMVHEEKYWEKQDPKYLHLTYRYYLADAVFLVGLEGNEDFLKVIESALSHPVFPLFLGRRSCPPEGKLLLGIRDKTLLEALREEPWLVSAWARRTKAPKIHLRIFTDADETSSNSYLQRDFPLTFNQERREYRHRRVTEVPALVISNETGLKAQTEGPTEHDPMSELGGE